MSRCLIVLGMLLASVPFRAAPEIDPLSLGIEASEKVEASQGALSLEIWLQHYAWRSHDSSPETQARLALDFRREWSLSPEWRATLSNRLESAHVPGGSAPSETRNTLREAFITWQGSVGKTEAERESIFVDAGRINLRLGVASGYNPTDYFRGGAVVSSVSQNPASLRLNRLGTVSIRTQWMDAAQSWTFVWAPQLTGRDEVDTRDLALGLERTNRQQAFLLRWAPRLGERVSLDMPLLVRDSHLEVGLNATALINDALVGTLELASARRAPLPDVEQSLAGQIPDTQRTLRIAAGGTWTAESGISLTLERHYAGDALSRGAWRSWQHALSQPGAPGGAAAAAYGELTADLGFRQDLLVRDMWFSRIAWDDAFQRKGLNLSAFVRQNAYDRSRSWQAEASWNDRRDWSLRVLIGGNSGGQFSEFGRRSQRGYGALSFTLYW